MNKCFNCGNTGDEFHGFIICENCKSALRLFSEATVQKYVSISKKNRKSYLNEVTDRLDTIEKEYIKKRLKLLDIQEKAKNL